MSQYVAPEVAAIRFAGPMNYRIEGDMVHLEADLQVCDSARASLYDWSLQFWTDEGGPAVRIAELPLGSVAAAPGAVIPVGGSAMAALPAGNRSHGVAFRLACRGAEGEEQHDFSSFAHAQEFYLPRLSGVVGYRFDGDNVELSVDAVENPREAGNLSGTLSLELWALPVAYGGGDFQGVPVAGIQIGSLAGQESCVGLSFSLPAAQLPPGEWHLTLMLREWTPSGFLTRDFSRFEQPYTVEAKAAPAAQAPVVVAEPEAPTPAKAPAPEVKVAKKPTAAKAAKEPAEAKPAEAKPAAAKSAVAKPAAAKAAKPAKPVEVGAVSVNKASVAELAAVKGVSKKLAEAIVAARPFGKLDDVLEVKGLGEKLFAKLKDQLKV